jgi:hypothetical protein
MPPKTENKNDVVTDLRELAASRSTKRVKFLDRMIEVNKLTLAECMEIQKIARELTEDNPEKGFDLLKQTIKLGVPAAANFTDEDFEAFPMDDLNTLSNEVLKLAGMQSVGK